MVELNGRRLGLPAATGLSVIVVSPSVGGLTRLCCSRRLMVMPQMDLGAYNTGCSVKRPVDFLEKMVLVMGEMWAENIELR